jgi:NhaP-type Na+/H+ or K+/H+ antiporter
MPRGTLSPEGRCRVRGPGLGHVGLVVGAFGIATLARAIAVYGLLALLCPFGRAVNLRWQTIIVWSSLRGAVPTALLLSLPQGPAELALIAPRRRTAWSCSPSSCRAER